MALQTATNPDTGERFALVDNEWVPFSKTASNPDTGERFGLIKDQWHPLAIKTAPASPVDQIPGQSVKAPPPKEETDMNPVVRGIANYPGQTEGLIGAVQTLGGIGLNKLGFEETGKSQIEKGLGKMKEGEAKTVSKESDELTEAWNKGIWTVVSEYLPYQAGVGLANAGESLAFAGLGALAGTALEPGGGTIVGAATGLVSKTLVKQGIKEAAEDILKKEAAKAVAAGVTRSEAKQIGKDAATKFVADETAKVITKMGGKEVFEEGAKAYGKEGAKTLGSYAGSATQAVAHGFGEVGQRALEEGAKRGEKPEDMDFSRVLPAVAVHAVADFINERVGLGALKIGEKAAEGLFTEIAKRIGTTGLKETGGEEIQTLAERFGAKLSLADADALKDYINTAGASFGMAIGPGTIGGARTHFAGKRAEAAASAENQDLRNQFTTSVGDPQANAPQPEAHHLALIAPATDANGNPLVGGTATPPTPAATTPTATTPTATTPTATTSAAKQTPAPAPTDALAKAQAYLDELSADQNKKPNASKLKGLVKELGIDAPAGEGFNARAIEAIKTHIAQGKSTTAWLGHPIQIISEPTLNHGYEEGVPYTLVKFPNANGTFEGEGSQSQYVRTSEITTPKGATVGTDTTTGGTSTTVATPAITTDNAPRPPSDIAGTVGGAGAVVPASTVGAKTQLSSLSQETQDEINRRRDEVQTLIEDGKPSKLIQNKLGFLNKMEDTHGVERFVPTSDGLPAKKPNYVSVRSLIDRGMQAAASFINRTPAYEGKDLEGAMKLADQYDAQTEKERQEALEKPKAAKTKNIKVSDEIIEEYNATREEVNKRADEDDSKRKQLADNLDKLHEERKAAEAKLENENLNDPANEAHIKYLDEQIVAAEAELQKHGGKRSKLPNWNKEITAAEKEVYLEHIFDNTIEEHNQAAKALIEHRREQGAKSREGEGSLDRTEQRLAKIYDDNRKATGKFFGFEFPTWDKLSPPAKAIYLRELAGKALTGHQQDNAFAQLAKHLISKNAELSEARKAEENKRIEERKKVIQERSREEEKRNKERLAKYERQSLGAARTSEFVPNNVVQAVKNNDLAGVLNGIVSALDKTLAPHRRIYKQIANLTAKLGLKTKIQLVDSLPEGDLAIYDSVTDTIKVTSEGLTYTTILHEVIHAASVRVLNHYMEGRKNLLTDSQIKAAEHILKIMRETQEALGEYHPDAYTNPYEFLAYSLTDKTLQADLHEQGIEYGLYSFLGQQREDIISIMPDKKSAWSEFKKAIAGIVGYKPGQLKSFNFVLELNAAFEDVLSVPTEPIYLNTSLPAKTIPTGKSKSGINKSDMDDPKTRAAYAHSEKESPESWYKKIKRNLTTVQGVRNIAKIAVDKTYPMRSWELRHELGNLIHYSGDQFNAISSALDLSTGEKAQFITHYLDQPLTELKSAFGDWMQNFNKSFKDATIDFHMYAEAFTETERREALWVMSVPFSEDNKGPKAVVENGKKISAAERRTHIVGDKSKGIPGLIDQVALSPAQAAQLWQELKFLAANYSDVAGYSPRDIKIDTKKPNAQDHLKMWSPYYTAVGLDEDAVKSRMDHFNALSNAEKAAILRIFTAAKSLSDATKELNKIGNYWSFPVTNITDMYNYQYYMPFKGLSKSETEDMIDPNTVGNGKAVQEMEHEAMGRFSIADDPLARLMQDAYKSANRAAIRNYTLAIKNALPKSTVKGEENPNGTGILDGKIKAHIPFAERQSAKLEQYKGGPYVFHYNPDGSIDVLEITKKDGMLDAIRYTFRKPDFLLDAMNSIVGWIGANHTRFNFNFAPKNFVTDTMTNAWNMGGGMMGPLAAPKYLGMVAGKVLTNGLGKAYQVAMYHTEGDLGSQKVMLDMAKEDPFVRDMMEMIKVGGKTVYIDSMSLKSNIEVLKNLNPHWVITKWEQFQALVDTWSTMFELTSRTAAYQMFKDYYLQQNLKKGLSKDDALQAAIVKAAADTKNLTNFEKVGEWGRGLGALYMFIRPSAISAARAVETAAPAFTTEASMANRMPKAVLENPAAKAAYMENYKKLRMNSATMTLVLTGLGMAVYHMFSAMAPDDDWERNAVKSDDMSQWTRNARFHVPDSWGWSKEKNLVINVPWGFGLGAFPAIGAQFASMLGGYQSFKDGMGNIMGSILTDSFLPIPISRIPISEQPWKWALDSVMPSILRPGVEYAMNVNGIGQAINSAQQRKFGAAFTGGDKIPAIYKEFSEWLYKKTEGEYNVPPNSAYFLANSYIDGWAKFGELMYSWSDLAKGAKEYHAKTDMPVLGSFFGSKSNVDAREFGKLEEKVKDLDTRFKTLKKVDIGAYASLMQKNPMAETAIHMYTQEKARLDRLHARANEIRINQIFTPKEKEEMLNLNVTQQNMLKHQMVERFKLYGIEP